MRNIPEGDIGQRGLRVVDKQIGEGPVHVLRDERPTYVVMTEAHYAELVDAWHDAVVRGGVESSLDISPGQYDEAVTTMSGVIDLVSIQGRNPQFAIRERWTGRHVLAQFDESLMESVTQALKRGRQVEVTGLIRFRGSNDPISIRDVTRIWWWHEEPADLLAFEGVLPGLTNGMDEGDYIRELRSGSIDE